MSAATRRLHLPLPGRRRRPMWGEVVSSAERREEQTTLSLNLGVFEFSNLKWTFYCFAFWSQKTVQTSLTLWCHTLHCDVTLFTVMSLFSMMSLSLLWCHTSGKIICRPVQVEFRFSSWSFCRLNRTKHFDQMTILWKWKTIFKYFVVKLLILTTFLRITNVSDH